MNQVKHAPAQGISDATKALHASLFIADLHADSLLWHRDLLIRSDYGQVDFPRMQEGNVALQMFTTVTKSPAGLNYHENSAHSRDNITLLALIQGWPMNTWGSLTARALHQSDRLHKFAERAPDTVRIIKNQADLAALQADRAAATKTKPMGAILGTEGSHALDGELANIERLYQAGFRMMSLQHFFDNQLGGSLHGVSHAGLTEFGRAAVQEMTRLGIMIDVAHSSEQVVRDVLALNTQALIVSHTGIYSHCPNERNIPDTLMQSIAAKGGLIGIGFWRGAVCDDSPKGVANAIQAAVNLVGEDAVALGSDYDGSVTTGFDSSQLLELTQALVDLGMSESTIAKVMGGNQARFFAKHLPSL
ncbi:dipeptidase [Simiduia curdlanivorans]|uniref:Dipeptidase n=1 Tax=Simiduia curdlanivorans TaxID=1492769 RepID=A0ABV8VAF3_9GAMM|nr:dipeptidase [Simiduia curdlanivorans]MDN3639053.1 dipeptidase [Simiduia curdlanivorans]